MATCPSIPAARFAFCLCFIRFVFVVRCFFSGEPKQNQGRGLVNRKLVQDRPPPPFNFITSRPKAAFLFWFFGGLRCGMWLCIVILVRFKKRK